MALREEFEYMKVNKIKIRQTFLPSFKLYTGMPHGKICENSNLKLASVKEPVPVWYECC